MTYSQHNRDSSIYIQAIVQTSSPNTQLTFPTAVTKICRIIFGETCGLGYTRRTLNHGYVFLLRSPEMKQPSVKVKLQKVCKSVLTVKMNLPPHYKFVMKKASFSAFGSHQTEYIKLGNHFGHLKISLEFMYKPHKTSECSQRKD